ncbi:MAG: hypothetical protein O3B04_07190 [Chloroflexi bacterium]|nr:hypothetical protein [Chloroflexota bacterium]
MRVASVLLLALLLTTALAACASRTREIYITNDTGEPIDVIHLRKAPGFGSLWHDYEGKQVGDDDPSTGCDLCNLKPGETDYIVQTFADRSRIKIVARSSADRKIIYLEAMTGRELKDRDWSVVIR